MRFCYRSQASRLGFLTSAQLTSFFTRAHRRAAARTLLMKFNLTYAKLLVGCAPPGGAHAEYEAVLRLRQRQDRTPRPPFKSPIYTPHHKSNECLPNLVALQRFSCEYF